MKRDDIWKKRTSDNLSDRRNPFANMLEHMVPPVPRLEWNLPPMELNKRMQTDDLTRDQRVTSGTAKLGRPFTKAMDTALKTDRLAENYRTNNMPERGFNTDDRYWEPDSGEAWTTRKDQRPALGMRRDKPTTADAMDHARRRDLRKDTYLAPDFQRQIEVARRRALEAAKSFEKGLELARGKGKIIGRKDGLRGPGGTK